MFDVPSRDDVDKVVITDEVVRDHVNPTIVARTATPRRERREKSA